MYITLNVQALGIQTRINTALLASYTPLVRTKHGEDVVCGSLLVLDGKQVRCTETCEEIDKLVDVKLVAKPVAKPVRVAS